MDRGAPREGDDRLVAVGRALAQSLLAGQEIHVPERHEPVRPDPPATAPDPVEDAAGPEARPGSLDDLRTGSFIPPPAHVEPGAERMEPPRRRRRSAFEPSAAEWSTTTPPEPTPAVDLEPSRPAELAEPAPVTDAIAAVPTGAPVGEHDVAIPGADVPQVARIREPEPTPPDPSWNEPAWSEPAWTEDDWGAPSWLEVDDAFTPEAVREVEDAGFAPAWPEGPAWTGAGDVETPFDRHAQELFESLPWAKDEPDRAEQGRARRRRRRPGSASGSASGSGSTSDSDGSGDRLPVPAEAVVAFSGPHEAFAPAALEPVALLAPPAALGPAPVETTPEHRGSTQRPTLGQPPRHDDRPAPAAEERPRTSGTLSPTTAAGWIAEHPILERPDEATVRLVGTEEEHPGPTARRTVVEWGMVLGSAVVVSLLVKLFVIQSFSIPSESMYPTLKIDDRVAVNQLAYDVGGDVERFDVIVFRRVEGIGPSRPDDPEFLIKRVIGLPGETIEARGGIVHVDGKPLDESAHLDPQVVTNNITQPIEVPQGHYWVMGDNRERSGDSRIFGPVPKDHIVGRAMAVWWPFDRAGSL